jgi:hypothetical protein
VDWLEEQEQEIILFNRYTLEQFREAKFIDVKLQSEMIAKQKLEKWRNQMVSAAFTAWLLGAGSSESLSFQDLLRKYDLKEPTEPVSEKSKAKMVDKALTTAEKIMMADLQQNVKK